MFAARIRILCVAAIVTLLACADRNPLLRPVVFVHSRGMGLTHLALEKVAIAPFFAGRTVTGQLEADSGLEEGVGHIQHLLAAALQARGVEVIAANDVGISFGDDSGSPFEDPAGVAKVVARDFKVTSIMIGKVTRYRDVETGGVGPPRPASVAFTVSIHSAPDGRRLWTSRYDETQVTLTDNPQRARHYPGRGSRRLSALDLARFGVEKAIEAIVENTPF